ncbi:hypothetical protein [Clostridium sp. FP1]|uniref:hypothetical protein n=1 Tax=Clostridium sp. FP1 TaxID=2724076 RepID=UPI0013E96EA1|nr:hypothetical protein [Clostridium sp. FP1]MBZ9634587.1 hypothetical protein [Clostridium sp. FP1]
MLPYSNYGKSRKLLETFRLIKSGIATTPQEIADIFETSPDNIHNYVKALLLFRHSQYGMPVII